MTTEEQLKAIIEDVKAAEFEKWKATREFYQWNTTDEHALLNFNAGWQAARQSNNVPVGWYIKGLDKQDSDRWQYTQNKGDFEYASILGLEIEPRYTSPQQSNALEMALERMDRARNILTDGKPTRECNWGMLDTSDLRALIPQPESDGK
jgi:hypothetical protein